MLSSYVLNVKPSIQLNPCVYGIYFAAKYIFQLFIKSQRGCGLHILPTLAEKSAITVTVVIANFSAKEKFNFL